MVVIKMKFKITITFQDGTKEYYGGIFTVPIGYDDLIFRQVGPVPGDTTLVVRPWANIQSVQIIPLTKHEQHA